MLEADSSALCRLLGTSLVFEARRKVQIHGSAQVSAWEGRSEERRLQSQECLHCADDVCIVVAPARS
jgi:Fe-S-cluster-containing dehydrogenase component